MNFMNRLSIGAKILSGFSVMLVLMLIIGLSGIFASSKIQSKLTDIHTVKMPAMDFLIEADRDLQQLLVAERSLIFTDPSSPLFAEFEKEYKENSEQAYTRWTKYTKLANTDEEKSHFALFENAHKKWKTESKKSIELAKSATPETRDLAIAQTLGPAKKHFEEMRDQIDQLTELILKNTEQESQAASQAYKGSIIVLFSVIGLAIVLGILASMLISKRITGPVNQVVQQLKGIAQGEGDLTQRINLESRDELGVMAKWFNAFMDNMQKLIIQLKENSTQLHGLSEKLTTLATDTASKSSSASSNSETIASAMEELSVTMNTIASSMEQSNTASGMVAASTEEMSSTILEIAQNAENAKHVSSSALEKTINSTTQLSELSQAITDITKVLGTIDDIASQVNLLALNATIEAASAGEAGKGFAVVANEVKDLANQSSLAAQEIAKQIDNIQVKSNASMEGIQGFKEMVEQVNNVVSSIAAAVEEQSIATKEINQNISQTTQGIREVNQNLGQTNEVTASVSNDLSQLNQMVADISEIGNNTSESALHLKTMSETLQNKVERFKV